MLRIANPQTEYGVWEGAIKCYEYLTPSEYEVLGVNISVENLPLH